MKRLCNFLMLSFALLGANGCYDPDLGATPFRCATTGDPCPEGYECNAKTKVCVAKWAIDAAATSSNTSDGGIQMTKDSALQFDGAIIESSDKCTDKDVEPNNTGATATMAALKYSTDWTICYPGDIDQYYVDVKAAQNLSIKIKFTNANGDIDAALLNPEGQIIMTSRSTSDIELLSLTGAPADARYYFVVYGFNGATNRYDLDVSLQ